MDTIDFALNEINPLIQCSICRGYLVDPQTIRECMHTFCRTCILLHFETSSPDEYQCPKCHIHLPPYSDLSKCLMADRQINDVLQVLIPNLETDEMINEMNFYQKNSRMLPKDLQLRMRLVPELTTLRYVDEHGRTRLRRRSNKTILSTKTSLATPIALQIEFSRKFIDPSFKLKNLPKPFLCLSAQLHIGHVRKYLETICQISSPFRVYLFFYESCLKDSTPLLLMKNLLFSSNKRLKLFYSIMSE